MKPYRVFAIVVFVIFTLAFATNVITHSEPTLADNAIHNELKRIVPKAKTFRLSETTQSVYEALDSNENIIGYAFYTKDLVRGINGYGGHPIEMAVSLDLNGDISGVQVLKHQETPGFSESIDTFFNQFTNRNIRTPFELGNNIDGITGATITSSAIVQTINASAQRILPELNLEGAQTVSLDQHQRKAYPTLAVMLCLFALAGFACVTRKKLIRWMALTSGFIFLGLLFTQMLSTSHFAGIALFQNPSWAQSPLLHFLLLGALTGSIVMGRLYCSGVCPFAFVEEVLHGINKRFVKLTLSPNAKTDYVCRWIKYILLTIILVGCLLLKNSGVGAVEVYLALFFGTESVTACLLLLIVLVASFFFLRFWCRYLCPCGAFLALLSQLKLYKSPQRAPSGNCKMCGDSAECFYCDQCTRAGFSKSTPQQNACFIVLITIALVTLAFSLSQTIRSVEKTPLQIEKPMAPSITQAYQQ